MNLRNRLTAKLSSLTRSGREIRNCRSLLFHQQKSLIGARGRVSDILNSGEPDAALIERIIKAYQGAHKTNLGNSIWKAFFTSYHHAIHRALMDSDIRAVTEIFRDPESTELLYGFDVLTKSLNRPFYEKRVGEAYARVCLDGLVRFAESVGVLPLDNPENWPGATDKKWETAEVLAQLRTHGWTFTVPNPFPAEHGLKTAQGILSYRVPQALYQAGRIKQLVRKRAHPRILEIGGGLGRTAYYACELGLKDYSIVDIPITAACQAYFLGRTIGEDHIHLEGERSEEMANKIKIMTPQTFLSEDKSYDVIINADSLTEMDIAVARSYWNKIKSSTGIFLSINHEANSYRVREIIAENGQAIEISRYPYWMRRGYVEELISIKSGNTGD